jgi:hypothetical protein
VHCADDQDGGGAEGPERRPALGTNLDVRDGLLLPAGRGAPFEDGAHQ